MVDELLALSFGSRPRLSHKCCAHFFGCQSGDQWQATVCQSGGRWWGHSLLEAGVPKLQGSWSVSASDGDISVFPSVIFQTYIGNLTSHSSLTRVGTYKCRSSPGGNRDKVHLGILPFRWVPSVPRFDVWYTDNLYIKAAKGRKWKLWNFGQNVLIQLSNFSKFVVIWLDDGGGTAWWRDSRLRTNS